MGHLVVNKCSSFGLVHLTALGRPVRLKFLYLSFSSNYVMFACIVLMLFHQKDLYVLLPVLYSKCWILQIPHQDLQCCNSSSSPSIPREETFMTKNILQRRNHGGKCWFIQRLCLTLLHPRPEPCPVFHHHMQIDSLHPQLAPEEWGMLEKPKIHIVRAPCRP